MHIIVNGKLVAQLNPRVFERLAKGKPADLIVGTVLSSEGATAKLIQSKRVLMTLASVLIVTLLIWYKDPAANSMSKSVQTLGLFFAITVLLWTNKHRIRLWNEELPARIASNAPAGSAVRLDATGISIGSQTADWSVLRISEIELRYEPDSESSILVVERMMLAGAVQPITLDATFIENGKLMIETACRRLLPKEI